MNKELSHKIYFSHTMFPFIRCTFKIRFSGRYLAFGSVILNINILTFTEKASSKRRATLSEKVSGSDQVQGSESNYRKWGSQVRLKTKVESKSVGKTFDLFALETLLHNTYYI